jgi:hypothetical protein
VAEEHEQQEMDEQHEDAGSSTLGDVAKGAAAGAAVGAAAGAAAAAARDRLGSGGDGEDEQQEDDAAS